MGAKLSPRMPEPVAAAPLTTPQFFDRAGEEQLLSRLMSLFEGVISSEHVQAHHCSRLVLDSHLFPLFGTSPDHAAIIGGRIGSDPMLAERPGIVERAGNGLALLTFPVPLPMGEPLIVSLALNSREAEEIDRQRRARLNGLATIYAMKALPLWEIEEDIETASPLTLKERITLAMTLCGAAHIDIAEQLNCSIRAISGHISNAARKLEVEGETQAIALAARRGWLNIPHEFGITDKRLDH